MLKQGLHVSLIKISAHVHPTEVIDKVKLALSSLLAIDPASLEENLEDSALEGDYTNKIHALTWTIKKPKDIESFLSRMKDGLPDEQKKSARRIFFLILQSGCQDLLRAVAQAIRIREHVQHLPIR